MAHNQRRQAQRLDTGPVVHDLYVLVVESGARAPSDQKARSLTLAILKYVHDRLGLFKEMGVRVNVHRVKKADLRNPRLTQAMKARGITSLPALVTPNNVYVGNKAIGDVYERNIQEFQAWKRRDVEGPTGMAPEDDLASYYRSEMSFERAAEDDGLGGDGDEIGEGGDMMDAYRSMMQKREQRDQKRPGGRGTAAPEAAASTGGGARRRPAAAGGQRRPDNITGGSGDTMDAMIDRLAGGIDSQTFEDAFSGGGGDSLDLEGLDQGGNAQDSLMESAYWANQELSM